MEREKERKKNKERQSNGWMHSTAWVSPVSFFLPPPLLSSLSPLLLSPPPPPSLLSSPSFLITVLLYYPPLLLSYLLFSSPPYSILRQESREERPSSSSTVTNRPTPSNVLEAALRSGRLDILNLLSGFPELSSLLSSPPKHALYRAAAASGNAETWSWLMNLGGNHAEAIQDDFDRGVFRRVLFPATHYFRLFTSFPPPHEFTETENCFSLAVFG